MPAELSPRLQALADCVPPARVVADIGCDHGFLGQYLLDKQPALRLIAGDVSAPSLQKARRRLSARFDTSRFELRLGDGLEVLSAGEADVIVIAGLGGRSIAEMLARSADTARTASRLVLGPHSHPADLRRALAELDFGITDECVAEDRGHYYPIVLASPGGGCREEEPMWYETGRILPSRQDPASRRYGEHLLRQAALALGAVGASDPNRAAALRRRLLWLRKVFAAETGA